MTSLPPPAAFVTAIDHVGIAVPDFAAAVEFYRATFGLELVHEEINEEQGVHEGMLRAPGDSGTGAAVQLLAPLGPTSTIAKFLDRNGPGMQQLAYRVTSIETAMAALRAAGVRLLYTVPGAVRLVPESTSCTPKMPAACWSSWWSQPPLSTSLWQPALHRCRQPSKLACITPRRPTGLAGLFHGGGPLRVSKQGCRVP